ncbi:uroporphyrinogen-III synthase [Roseinatronobacter sp. S2]|uniref:uroporphyrinogen-III synthase n=1 Tax=Roseinatronobacter sp. S2 TaxID=3035471 RepID=UPI0024109501|nr:uroporphyrinogen-III synthase [Roseinatronobacter sp. S2]WFE74262.1 uroporphyrinogen-III synthase [Roseinatronobacter sp. S2]
MTATLLLTRPELAAQEFAQAATGAGWWGPVVVAPLMQIGHCTPDMSAVAGAGTLVFTSRHGVGAWRALGGRCDLPVWCVGPRTAQAAKDAGFAQIRQAPGGDAVSLRAAILAAGPVPPVLHLRGAHAAMALAAGLNKAGVPAQELVIYHQQACALSAPARALLLRPVTVVVPLFSPRSAHLFSVELEKMPYIVAKLRVIAISRACAAAVDASKCSSVLTVTRPDGDAMLNAVLQVQAELEDSEKPR